MSIANISNAQWEKTNFPLDKDLNRIFYTSENKLWGYGGSPDLNIILSNDGGNTFEFPTNQVFRTINFFSPITDSIGYLVGRTATTSNNVFKSTDGGRNWFVINTPDSLFYNKQAALIVYDALNICLVSQKISNGCNEIYTSINGGLIWQRISCDSIIGNSKIDNNSFSSFLKTPNQTVLEKNKILYKIFNKGTSCKIDTNLYSLNNITFIDNLNGIGFRRYLISTNNYYSTIHFTEDGGYKWDSISQIFQDITISAFAKKHSNSSSGFYIAGSKDGAIFSQDSGLTWKSFDSKSHRFLSFYDSKNGISYSPFNEGGDGFTKFIGPITKIEKVEKLNTFSLFPNPATNKITIDIPNKNLKNYQANIYDYKGSLIKNMLLTTNEIDIENLSQGLYLLELVNMEENTNIGQKRFIRKFIKE